ncbi:MAG: BatA domain-containing protein [Acidobacteriota bacterium]
MSFLALSSLQALMLTAATAAAIVGLYWLRPPPRRVVIPSSLLWNRLMKERRRSSLIDRLRWWISLFLALVIGLATALGLARPEIPALAGRPRRVAVVVDNSPSMATRTSDGQTRWAHAVEIAEALLRRGSEGGEYLVADTAGQVASSAFSDRRAAQAVLEGLQVSLSAGAGFPPVAADDAELYFISDGVMVDDFPAEAQPISVFEPADNVAITAFEVRPVPADPSTYQAYVEVANVSSVTKQIEVQLSGAGQHKLQSDIRLAPGESLGGTFDLSSFERGAVRAAVVATGDDLEVDDFAFSYLPVRDSTRVILVTRGNRYLEALLRLAPKVDLRRVSGENFNNRERADVYVFDNYAPDDPPGPSILIHPPDVSWLPAGLGEVEFPQVSEWAADHPLMQFVFPQDLTVERAVRISASGGAQVILGTSRTPLIVAAEEPVKWVEMSFDLKDSNFQLQAGFPVFLSNALAWVLDEQVATPRSLGRVEVPFAGATVTGLDGTEVKTREVLAKTVFEASGPGLYTAARGQKRMRLAVNLLDRTLSEVNDSQFPRATLEEFEASVMGQEGWGEELWVFFLLAAFFLVTLEWWTYHQRLTV